MRTVFVALVVVIMTPIFGTAVIIAAMVGWPHRPGGVYEWAPDNWSRMICWAAGLRVEVHGIERTQGGPRILLSNHVSWFDVFSLAVTLPRFAFIAKAELAKIPFFGPASKKVGTIFIERANRKAAFKAFDTAAVEVAKGTSVVVFPEGTRGLTYSLRPFKKGPFVLAITAGVPIVPTIVYGAREMMPKGTFRVRSGTVIIHFLEPVPTAGYVYERRDELMRVVWERMADALKTYHGIISEPLSASTVASDLSPLST